MRCLLLYGMTSHELGHRTALREQGCSPRHLRTREFSHNPEASIAGSVKPPCAFHRDDQFSNELTSVCRDARPNPWSRSYGADKLEPRPRYNSPTGGRCTGAGPDWARLARRGCPSESVRGGLGYRGGVLICFSDSARWSASH